MSVYADLEEFVHEHRPHGRLELAIGEPAPNGYRVTVACACGVAFKRNVLPQDAAEDLLTEALQAARAGMTRPWARSSASPRPWACR